MNYKIIKPEAIERPDNAKAFPGVKIGGTLWNIDLGTDPCWSRAIVCHVFSDDYVLVFDIDYLSREDGTFNSFYFVHYGCNWHFATVAEAVAEAVESDQNYIDRLKRSIRRFSAAKTDADLAAAFKKYKADNDQH